jgi:hypothetical protein
MSDTASIGMAQRAFWNSDATRRWVTEQTVHQFPSLTVARGSPAVICSLGRPYREPPAQLDRWGGQDDRADWLPRAKSG